MEDNLYAPPLAAVGDVREARAPQEFFIVSPLKFALLFAATFGLYQVYWWYMHWARYRRFRRQSLWPVARAVFAIFFAHSLNEEIDARLRRDAKRHVWSPRVLAGLYVVCVVAARILARIDGSDAWGVFTIVGPLLPTGYALLRTQQAANLACGDPAGGANARLTWANWLWLVGGGLAWLLIALGLALPDLAADAPA